MMIKDIVEYPEEGFAILSDSNGKFLAFRDSEDIVDLEGDIPLFPVISPRTIWDFLN